MSHYWSVQEMYFASSTDVILTLSSSLETSQVL